jgi:hypothetical protein
MRRTVTDSEEISGPPLAYRQSRENVRRAHAVKVQAQIESREKR